jgi:hypothetical protein
MQLIIDNNMTPEYYKKKSEFKWHPHPGCKEAMISQSGIGTLEERKKTVKQLEGNDEKSINTNAPSKTGIVSKNIGVSYGE